MGAMVQLDQKAVWWSALGLVLGGGLIFLAGLVVGVSLGGPALLAEGGTPPTPELAAPDPGPPGLASTAPSVPPEELAALPDASATSPPVLSVSPRDPGPEAVVAEAGQPAGEPEDTALSPFSLQVGAYLMQENLDRALADLEKKGLEARVVEITDSRGTILSSIRVGTYGDRSAAEQAADQLRQKKGLEVLVKRDSRQS